MQRFLPVRSLIPLTGFCFIILIAWWGCSAGDDVSAIRGLIERAVESAEKHEIGEIIDLTTEDFQALPGKLNRASVPRSTQAPIPSRLNTEPRSGSLTINAPPTSSPCRPLPEAS